MKLATAALEILGVPTDDARVVAASIIQADLEGQGSHGLVRLPFLLQRLKAGLINPKARPRLLSDSLSAALLDGDNGLGPVVGMQAIKHAMSKARATGIGLIAVRHSNHLGSVGFYVGSAAREGFVALAFSNTPPAMAPPGGRTPFLGTNPIAAAFPTSGDPVVVDMATTQVARGRILRAAKADETIPEGWAADVGGRPTKDPHAALEGTLWPLGGPKGFALALLVEVLASVLSVAAVGPEVCGTFSPSAKESNVGHCFIAIDPDKLDAGFRQRMDRLSADIRGVPRTDPEIPVRLPGERRRAEAAERLLEGIEVADELVRGLSELTERPLS